MRPAVKYHDCHYELTFVLLHKLGPENKQLGLTVYNHPSKHKSKASVVISQQSDACCTIFTVRLLCVSVARSAHSSGWLDSPDGTLCRQMDVVTSVKENLSVQDRTVLDDRQDLALLH